MIKLSADVTKKVPIAGVEFSSQSCSAGIEVEADGGATSQELLERLKQLYALLELAVDEQLKVPVEAPASSREANATASDPPQKTFNGNGRKATQAQIKAIQAIARERGVDAKQLEVLIQRECGAASLSDLSLKEASALIDALKNKGEGQ
jgi:hypothetical protein